MKNKRLVIIVALVFFALLAVTGMAAAKSLYVIADINGYPTPINAYDIQGTGIVFQQTSYVPSYAGGAVGLAIDTDSKYLFVTYEGSNVIQLVNATSMTDEGTTTAPGASNLAGIVVDQDKQKIYTVDRSTNHLYVYSWDSSSKTLTLDGGAYISLPGVSQAHGLALDESDDLLYIGDLTTQVKIFNTSDWSSVGAITVSQSVMGVALDVANGFVYTGNAYPGYGSTGLLCKYDLNTDTETTLDIRVLTGDSTDNVVGLAVDPASNLLYITTGNQGSGGTDKVIILNSNLQSLGSTSDIGGPTGLCVPGKEISYNPLNLVKDDRVAEGNCVNPGGYINYSICFDNTGNTVNNVNIVDTLPPEVVFIQASNGGTYNAGTHKVTWNIETLTPGQAQCEWLKVQVNLGTPPGTITNYATIDSDETPPTTQSEITTICEGVSDQDPPVTTKTIGFPQYDNGVWVTTKTPITLNAVDPGQNPSGVKEIHYKINGVEHVAQGDYITFNFTEECTHTLEFWAVDNANNEETHQNQTHYVDDTGPVQTFQFGQPRIDSYIQDHGEWFVGIGANTPMWINSTDVGCNGGVGSKSLTYELWIGPQWGDWIFEETHTINDNGPGDSDPTVGRISVLIYMDESCWHEIHYWCYDNLNNRAPKPQGSFLNKDFVVDADEPTTTWRYEGPQYGEYISCTTQKIIWANDTGCGVGGSGVEKINWWVDKKMYDDEWELVKSGTVYDNDPTYDLDQTIGKIKIAVTVDEDCEHHIYHQAFDNLGNVGEIDKQYVKVDCTPPVTTKEIGNPKYYKAGEDITYVTTSTPIWLNTTDYTAPCAVGCEYLHWEIWLFNDDTQEWDLIDSDNEYSNKAVIYFGEESYHKLIWWAVDYLGNQEDVYIQYHKVDNTPPTTTKEYGDPKCEGDFTCIASNTPIYLNATDGGECPVGSYMIYYKIWYNDQWTNWMNGALNTNVVLTMNDLGSPWNQDCEHEIEYYAVDDLMNTEQTQDQTFYVDNTPPVIKIQVGNPNCTITLNEEYCITPQTDIIIDSWNDGCCGNGYLYVEYKINDDGDWIPITGLPMTIRIPEECTHTLYVRAKDCLGNTASNDTIFHVDSTPPVIDKRVGQPNITGAPGEYWISCETPIIIDAIDGGCCGQLFYVGYNINNTGWVQIPLNELPKVIQMPEDCVHTLDIKAYDCLGNIAYDNETFYVDCTPPESNKGFFGPHYNASQADIDLFRLQPGDETDYFWLRDNDTEITIYSFGDGESEQNGFETFGFVENPCISGLSYIHIELWWDSNGDNVIDTQLWFIDIYDNDANDVNQAIGQIQYDFKIMEDCLHEIRWYASDKLGNLETTHIQKHRVDSTPPTTVKTFDGPTYFEDLNQNGTIEPEEANYWLTSETQITLTAMDQALPCAVGIEGFHVKIEWDSDCSGEVDETLYEGDIAAPYQFTFTLDQYNDHCCKEGLYKISWYSIDHLGNQELLTEQFHMVDDTAPHFLIIKPVDGWYSDGARIPSVVFAQDLSCPYGPCGLCGDAVGIENGKQGQAWVIDIFPSFNVIPLNTSNFIYNAAAHEFIGNARIPNPSGIPDGVVLFVAGGEDNLGNGGCSLLELVYGYYLQAMTQGGSNYMEVFGDLIADLIADQNIVWIGIDNTAPYVEITEPTGGVIGPDYFYISADMTDVLSGIVSGAPCYIKLNGVTLAALPYNAQTETCEGLILIPDSMPGGEDIPLEISVFDTAGNKGLDTVYVDLNNQQVGSVPTVNILSPDNDTTYEGTITVYVQAHDKETLTEDLDVKVWTDRQNDPPFAYQAIYDSDNDWFVVTLDVSKYQDGAKIKIQAYATDEDQNTGCSAPIICWVDSTIVYDQWMKVGWNLLNIPEIGDDNSLPKVFFSIFGDFDWVFEVSTWDNYHYGEGGNTLNHITEGGWYWVYMTTPQRFYLDVNPPEVIIADPQDGSTKDGMSDANINAYDNESAITDVYAKIYDQDSNTYYDGSNWQSNSVWLLCNFEGGNEWTYYTEDIWTNGHHYIFTAKAYDEAGNAGYKSSSFTIIYND